MGSAPPSDSLVQDSRPAVDPTTGDLPSDPALGLLQPNDATGRGEGFVRYSIRPLAQRDAAGAITGFEVDVGRARGIGFRRVMATAVE